MRHIETCIREGCYKAATHTTANGAYCDDHPCKGGAPWEPTGYAPGVVAAYDQGRADALHAAREAHEADEYISHEGPCPRCGTRLAFTPPFRPYR